MKSTVKAVGLVMAITIFSRLLSLLSNLVYITYFGINLETDIYSYAIQLPNIIFNSFGTALVTVVIPVFAGYIGTGEKDRAFRFANNVTSLSTLFTIGLTIMGIVLAPFIILMTRFRYEGYDFALMSLRIMFPVVVFYALNYILQGILQSLGKYNAPALVSIPSSLVVILYVFLLGGRFGVAGLVVATFLGLSLQALILIPPIFKTEYRYRPSFNFRDEDIKKAMKLVPPILLGTSAYQVNMLFNATLSANFENTVALMITVQNLVLYAILAFIYSVTSVIFPKLTMLAARNDMEGFKDSLLKVLKSVLYLMIPAAAGFIAVRYQLIDFLYGWGKVTGDNVLLASRILALYALGVIGIGIKEVVDRAFYSLKDTKRPAINGVVIMLVNIGTSLALVSYIGVLGIPLAYSVSALIGALVLMIMIRKKIGPFGEKKLVVSVLKIVCASAVMLAAVMPLTKALEQLSFGYAVLDKALRLFIPCAAGGIIYFISTYMLKVEEAVDVLKRLRGTR
jgi:putative peptidoglycan lipid II flippase